MKTKLIIAWIGNLIDIFSTLYLLNNYSFFYELNPLMRWLLQWPILAVVCKLVVVGGILIYIYYKQNASYANSLANFAAVLYGGLGVYYILWFSILNYL